MEQSTDESISRKLIYLIIGFSVVEFLLHLYTNAFAGYGYFRDELYYIACSKRLAWGYVDQPPLSIFILSISIKLFGSSIFGLRFLPALVSGVTVYLAGLITQKLGGRNFAVTLTCLSVAIAPEFLGTNSIYSMNGFDWLFWSLAGYIVLLIVETDISGGKTGKLWIWLGVVLGFGLLNKIDVLWLGLSLFIGLLLTPQRKYLKSKWPYVTGAIAFVIFSPYVIWNWTHDFATLEFIHRASALKYSSLNPGTFISGTIDSLNKLALPVWIAGIYFFFFYKDGKRFSLLGYLFIVSFIVLIINWHSKPEYIAPAFPIVFAAGGVMFEKIAHIRGFGWTRFVMPLLVAVYGLVALPFAIPVLPAESFIKYSNVLGVKPSTSERQRLANLPQWYADMFGWENMAVSVSRVYTSLSPEDQRRAKVFAQNYGEAGAIDFFSKKYPLPPVICPHNNFWYWGYGDTTRNIIIAVGGKKEDYLRTFSSVDEVGMIQSKYAMPYESNLRIFICSGLKLPIEEVWEKIRFFI
jgi:Dolichyl-phosphate-mannose-protein mannosyltransferase